MEILQKAMHFETIEEVKDCCINVITEIMQYNFCFIEFETDDCLGMYYTADDLTERFMILKKEYIHSISIVYAQDFEFEDAELSRKSYI